MKAFRSISAVLLALLVLVSSTSFMIGVHYCKGEVKSVALFSKADSCAKEKSLPPCHRQQTPCCADETVLHDGEDFKAAASHLQIVVPTPLDIEHPPVLISEIIPVASISRTHFYNYDPPLRSWDLTVEHHVFLI